MATLQTIASREERLTSLYQRFYPPIYRYLLGLTHYQVELAEDLTQEVFVRMIKQYDERIGPGVISWLYRIARNLYIDTYRRMCNRRVNFQSLEIVKVDGILLSEALSSFADMEADVTRRETLHEELAGFRMLPRDDQQMMLMDYLGYSTEEIAAHFGMHPTAIKTRRWRIRHKLKEAAA